MKLRYLRRFLNKDDSFSGQFFNGKSIGLPFNIVTSLQTCKQDKIPRIHLIQENEENLAKAKNTRSYQILAPGVIKRIEIYHKNFNEQDEKILKLFTKIFYKDIVNYFFQKDNKSLSEQYFKQYLI